MKGQLEVGACISILHLHGHVVHALYRRMVTSFIQLFPCVPILDDCAPFSMLLSGRWEEWASEGGEGNDNIAFVVVAIFCGFSVLFECLCAWR